MDFQKTVYYNFTTSYSKQLKNLNLSFTKFSISCLKNSIMKENKGIADLPSFRYQNWTPVK